jgi:hypothetical protein
VLEVRNGCNGNRRNFFNPPENGRRGFPAHWSTMACAIPG